METGNIREDERACELEMEFNYDGYQIVRRELFAHLREPSLTIRYDSITFNTACINGLEDTVYIQILVDDEKRRIAIRRCKENDKDAVRWCIAKSDKRKSRTIKGRFSQKVYEMMKWDAGCRYKMLGHKITHQNEQLYIFELDECEIFKERVKLSEEQKKQRAALMTSEEIAEIEKMERKETLKPFSPRDIENTFGLPVNEHLNTIILDNVSIFEDVNECVNMDYGGLNGKDNIFD